MLYSDDTAPTIDLENPEDKMVFLTRHDVQHYFNEEDLPLRKPLKKSRKSLISYFWSFFR